MSKYNNEGRMETEFLHPPRKIFLKCYIFQIVLYGKEASILTDNMYKRVKAFRDVDVPYATDR